MTLPPVATASSRSSSKKQRLPTGAVTVLVLALLSIHAQSAFSSSRKTKQANKAETSNAEAEQHQVSDNRTNNFTDSNSTQASSLFRVHPDDAEYSDPGRLFQPYVLEPYRLVFFFVPKNGCTMWKTLFRKMMGLNESINDVHDPQRNGLTRLGDYSLEQATEFMTSPDWTRAMFVRDPVERWLSAYLDKIVHFPPLCRKCCIKHLGRNASKPTIQRCRHKIQQSPTFALRVMRQSCPNRHWNPQSRRLQRKYQARINFWGHVETVQHDSEALLRRLGVWHQFGATGWGRNGTQRLFDAHVKDGRPHATHAQSKVSQYITPSLERSLVDFYQLDYNNPHFGLNRPADRQSASRT